MPDRTDSYGACVFRFKEDQMQVLMIRTRYGWSFPKGHREGAERPDETAVREILEETGVAATVNPDFSFTVPSARPGDERTVTFFLGSCVSSPEPLRPDEVPEARWVDIREAGSLIAFAPDKEAFSKALAAFAAHR